MQVSLKKEELVHVVEDFIINRLHDSNYFCETIAPSKLLTYNRFDLALKLAYLSLKEKIPKFATEIYFHDIRSQTLGCFKEYGNKKKNSFEVYVEHFNVIFKDLENNGYDAGKSVVPLDELGTILNGAHRVASSIFLDKEITCVKTELEQIKPDYQYFTERNVPEFILDFGAVTFSDFSENTYLSFLWPSGRSHYEQTEILFNNVVYKKKIKLEMQGGLNLLIELYKHMNWVGSSDNGFLGAQKKLTECFTDFDEFIVILFQAESLEKVKEIKKRVRQINKIGFSSIHITDTKEEVKRISRLIFNQNGLHFLNHGRPYKFSSNFRIANYLSSINKSEVNHIILGGSMTLSIYGLREARDVDYFSGNDFYIPQSRFDFESHDSQLEFHKVSKSSLIYNPKYYFEYLGVRFLSFEQTYQFKKMRNERKDINDCHIMNSLIEKNRFKSLYFKFRQKLFYKVIVYKSKILNLIFFTLRITGTHELARLLYLKLKRQK